MLRRLLLWLACAAVCGPAGAADAFRLEGSVLTVRTDRYEATFERGALTSLANRLTGEVYARRRADFNSRLAALPHGLGVLPARLTAADQALLGRFHAWEGGYEGHLRRTKAFPFACQPHEAASASLKRIAESHVQVTWKGLRGTYPPREPAGGELTLDLEVLGGSGDLAVGAVGRSRHKGAYAVGVAMANFSRELNFIVPLFQGCHFRPKDLPPFQKVAHWPNPFVASVVVAEGEKGSAAMWLADPLLRDRYFHLHNGAETFDVAFESVNQAPFDELREAPARPLRINVYRGGWVPAAAAFRDWWAKTFRVKRLADKEPAWLREACWFSSFGRYLPPEELAPHCVYFAPQSWKVQPKIGDGGLFPYDVEAGPKLNRLTKEMIAELHRRGSHVLVYMNVNHMNEGHPWAAKFWPFRLHAPFGPALEQRPPEPRSARSFLVHSGCKAWQDLQLDWARRIDRSFGIKGYYIDCASGKPNHTGGLVGGMNDCRGQVELMRRIRTAVDGAFLNVEYAGEVTGQITDFAYLGFDGWFDARDPKARGGAFRGWRWRERNVHPIVGFLFNPYLRITTHDRGPASDAFDEVMGRLPVGGFGPLPERSVTYCSQTTDFPEFLTRLLCRTRIKPHYPRRWQRGVRAYYKGPGGEIYRVEADVPGEGRMTRATPGGASELLYWRIRGRTTARITGQTGIEGWVAYRGEQAIGLDPLKSYYYYARPRSGDWQITALPDGAAIDTCRPYADGALVVDLASPDGKPRSGMVEVLTKFPLAEAVSSAGAVELKEARREGDRRRYRVAVTAPCTLGLSAAGATALKLPADGNELIDLSQAGTPHFAYLSPSGVRETIPGNRLPHVQRRGRYVAVLPNYRHPGVAEWFLQLPPAPPGRKLLLTFTSTTPTYTNNSYTLRVAANGRTLLEELRKGGTGTKGHRVDLTPCAGRRVLLTVVVHNHMLFTWVKLVRPVIRQAVSHASWASQK